LAHATIGTGIFHSSSLVTGAPSFRADGQVKLLPLTMRPGHEAGPAPSLPLYKLSYSSNYKHMARCHYAVMVSRSQVLNVNTIHVEKTLSCNGLGSR
jgi:hypothetical protein